MPDLTPAHVEELRRLTVFLDHPEEVARAAGHRVNRECFTRDGESSPRRFPVHVLDQYARTYLRVLYAALAGLLDSPTYHALDDHRRRHAIRDAQARIAYVTDRALRRAFLAEAHVVTWTGPELDDSEVAA